LAILALEGSQVTDRGDHLVIRTLGNPDYWWGNFLLLRDLKPGSGGGWLARFAAEFPDAQHTALGLDEPGVRAVDPGELAGMTMERNAVMTATSVHAPPHPNTEAVFRTLEGDADWQQSLELTAALYAGEPGGDVRFLTAQLAAKRALTEAGHGAWSGAFLDGTLVSQLGLITVESGLARYQSVETHPAARRRGLAGTLVWHAGATALSGGTRTLVMVAEPDDAAIRVYRSVGFTVTEHQLSFIHQPAQSLPANPGLPESRGRPHGLCRALIPCVSQHPAQVHDHLRVDVLTGGRLEEFQLGPDLDRHLAVAAHGGAADNFQQRHHRPPLDVVARRMPEDLPHRIPVMAVKVLRLRHGAPS
jgi:GNAT superfamily N-acetyltransferase